MRVGESAASTHRKGRWPVDKIMALLPGTQSESFVTAIESKVHSLPLGSEGLRGAGRWGKTITAGEEVWGVMPVLTGFRIGCGTTRLKDFPSGGVALNSRFCRKK
jgi:hypothetical protein